MHACFSGNVLSCIFILFNVKDLLFLFKMQTVNYDLRALCTAEFPAQPPVNHLWFSCVHHITRYETPKDSGGMARYIPWSKHKASHALIQAVAPAGILNLGHSREALCFPGAASSQDHREAQLQGAPCCHDKPNTCILPSRWDGGPRNDCPSRPLASAWLQMSLHELPLQQEWEKPASDGYFDNCPPITSISLQLELLYQVPAHLFFSLFI